MNPVHVDPAILEYATPAQRKHIEAVIEHGNMNKAAEATGAAYSTVHHAVKTARAAAARAGHSPEHDMTHTVPDGFKVKGVSTYYDQAGQPRGQWVKSTADAARQNEILREALEAMASDLPVLAPTPAPGHCENALMACYPIGDAHIGMLSWPEETGEDWNLEIAEHIQCSAMDRLVKLSPAAKQAVIINLGDWFHADNVEGVTTRSGHNLDLDGRYAKMARVGVKIMRQCIESALLKHETVRVINVIGNHDDTGAMMLSVCLDNIYQNEPRVEVDTSPSAFHYFRHGKVLVGTHHGHSCKPDKLPGVMATDRPKDWGDSEHRYWWIGHVHHQSVKEYSGCTVESFRTLAAKDAYAHWGGYRAGRDMKCIVLHEQFGEVARFAVNPDMVRAGS